MIFMISEKIGREDRNNIFPPLMGSSPRPLAIRGDESGIFRRAMIASRLAFLGT
jgi:hypothetical protein